MRRARHGAAEETGPTTKASTALVTIPPQNLPNVSGTRPFFGNDGSALQRIRPTNILFVVSDDSQRIAVPQRLCPDCDTHMTVRDAGKYWTRYACPKCGVIVIVPPKKPVRPT
jgi:ribosomal protein S27AE